MFQIYLYGWHCSAPCLGGPLSDVRAGHVSPGLSCHWPAAPDHRSRAQLQLSVSSAGSGSSHQAVRETTVSSDEQRAGLKSFLTDLKNSRFEFV